jgi:hypothetical protein
MSVGDGTVKGANHLALDLSAHMRSIVRGKCAMQTPRRSLVRCVVPAGRPYGSLWRLVLTNGAGSCSGRSQLGMVGRPHLG